MTYSIGILFNSLLPQMFIQKLIDEIWFCLHEASDFLCEFYLFIEVFTFYFSFYYTPTFVNVCLNKVIGVY